MTRSGAPVQGACGDGKTVTSAVSAQASDAAIAGDAASENNNKEDPPAVSKNAVAAAAKRRPRSIWRYTPLLKSPDLHAPPPADRIARYRIRSHKSAELKPILRFPTAASPLFRAIKRLRKERRFSCLCWF
jgi:hypothetical protein